MELRGSADETIKNWYSRCMMFLSYKSSYRHGNQSMCVFVEVGPRKVRRKFTVEKVVHTIYYSEAQY